MLNIFNETSRKYAFAEFLTRGGNPELNKRMMQDLGMSDEYNHIEHTRELHRSAAAKQQQEFFNKFFAR